jgi:hypothetical protein
MIRPKSFVVRELLLVLHHPPTPGPSITITAAIPCPLVQSPICLFLAETHDVLNVPHSSYVTAFPDCCYSVLLYYFALIHFFCAIASPVLSCRASHLLISLKTS